MSRDTPQTLCLIVPCFNEADGLSAFYARCEQTASTCPRYEFRYLFIDDGSTDDTWRGMQALAAGNARISAIRLSRNYGHQRAITAGLDVAMGDVFAIMDADLQDPPELLCDMLTRLEEGYDLVHAVRANRQSDTTFKRVTAAAFYAVVQRWVLPDLPANAGDYKLFNTRVLEAVRQYREHVRFLRGAFATVGFRQASVTYTRPPRHAGHSKYPLRSMLRFARDAIFSNSALPLRWSFYTGAALLAAWLPAMLLLLAFAGPSMVLLAIALQWAFSALLLTAIGLTGEYLKIIVLEVKDRPMYLVSESVNMRRD